VRTYFLLLTSTLSTRPGAVPLVQSGIAEPATVRFMLEDVETLAVGEYRWKLHTGDPGSYWVAGGQAAVVLGVSIQRVKQLPELRHRATPSLLLVADDFLRESNIGSVHFPAQTTHFQIGSSHPPKFKRESAGR